MQQTQLARALAADAGGFLFGGYVSGSGTFDMAIGRFTADGVYDTSFDTSGWNSVDFQASSSDSLLDIQTDSAGRIVGLVQSGSTRRLVRYDEDGQSLDANFDSDGVIELDARNYDRMKIHTDDAILVSEGRTVVRYLPDGVQDTSFGDNGRLDNTDFVSAWDVDSDGTIYLIAGIWNGTDTDVRIRRYAPDGTLEATFADIDLGGQENITTAFLDENDGLFIAGNAIPTGANFTASKWMVFRMKDIGSNGTLDSSFGTNGAAYVEFPNGNAGVLDAGLDSQGRIVISGYGRNANNQSESAVARFNSNGILDGTFGTAGIAQPPAVGVYPNALLVDDRDRILLSSQGGGNVVRLNSNGDVDTSFDDYDSPADGILWNIGPSLIVRIVNQGNGRLLFGGQTFGSLTQNDLMITRYVTEEDNLPPVAQDDHDNASFTTDQDSPFTTGSVLSNDSDPDGDSITVVSYDANDTLGIVTSNANGTFNYDPNGQFDSLPAGEFASDTFAYTITDGNGEFDSADVTVSVIGRNDNPYANDDDASLFEDTISVAVDLTSNDTDVDIGDDVQIESVDISGTLGTVVLNPDGDSISYSPNEQFDYLSANDVATDSFTYTITDGNGGTATATVTLSIHGKNSAPNANDDLLDVSEDGPSVNLNLTANDSDPDLTDSLTIEYVETTFTLGTVTLNPDGVSINYDPNGQFEWLAVGESTSGVLTYTATDGNGLYDTATVTININGQNDNPTVTQLVSSNDDLNNGSPDGNVLIEGMFQDLDLTDMHSVTVDWGDGSAIETIAAADINQADDWFAAEHDYATGGIFTITVTIDDFEGGVGTATTTAVVQGGMNFMDGTLYVVGTDGRDHINLSLDANGQLNIDAQFNQGAGPNLTQTYSLSSLERIVAYLMGGDDHFNGEAGGAITISQTVFGGFGNDHIHGGSGSDFLNGGEGNDNIFGRDGNDVLIGAQGSDNIKGGDHDDLLIAGATANQDDLAAVDAALASWLNGDVAAALLGLGTITDDDAGDDLKGQKGQDYLFGGQGDKVKD
ncbi:MAG: tandem-95 repeat protein [Planctomycetales bacterium]|nr:tandem-95 repeat protein [Planctomycetales bacterium]